MQDPSNRADHYRKEAAKYHELAKLARPDFLGDFYRRIAVRGAASTGFVRSGRPRRWETQEKSAMDCGSIATFLPRYSSALLA
jgi:hypothetical protein